MKSKTLYAVIGWQWNGYEYEPIEKFHDEDLDKARENFESIQLHEDLPMVTLREYVLESNDGITWAASKMNFLDERT